MHIFERYLGWTHIDCTGFFPPFFCPTHGLFLFRRDITDTGKSCHNTAKVMHIFAHNVDKHSQENLSCFHYPPYSLYPPYLLLKPRLAEGGIPQYGRRKQWSKLVIKHKYFPLDISYRMAESNEVKEGFICPICMKDLGTPMFLQSHFEEVHSSDEDPTMGHNIKGMFDKAKRKFMGKSDDGNQAMPLEKSEQTHNTAVGRESYFSYWDPQETGFCRNRTKEFREIRNQTIDDGIIEINKLLIRLEKILKVTADAKDSRLSGNSSKKAKERSLVPWISDSEAKLCFCCKKSFTVARRKHHCRLCGEVICGKCSEFLPLTLAENLCQMNEVEEMAANSDQTDTDDQDGFRVCSTCSESLLRHHELKKAKETKIPLVKLYERLTILMADADLLLPDFNKMAESLSVGDNRYPYREVVNARMKLLKIYETLELLSKKVIALGTKNNEADNQNKNTSPGVQSQKLQRGIHAFVTNYLQNNMFTLKSIPSEDEFETLQDERSRLLSRRAEREKAQQEKAMKERAEMHKEVLRKERDSRDSSPALRRKSFGRDPEPRNSQYPPTDPILEQILNVKEFLRKAKENGQVEEIRTLERNLNELQIEYDRRTKR